MHTHKHLVFVYGSLKNGYGNHRILEYTGAVFLDPGVTTNSSFTMESLGGFPGVYEDGGEQIRGELYAVTDVGLQRCDSLEGHPTFYCRKEVEITTDEGEEFVAWMYILPSNDQFRRIRGTPKERVEMIDGVSNWMPSDYEKRKWARFR